MSHTLQTQITLRLERMKALLNMSNVSIVLPETFNESQLTYADKWLNSLERKHLEAFNYLYNQPHTGEQFWNTMKTLGIYCKGGIFSNDEFAMSMKKVLDSFKRDVAKKVPTLFGGSTDEKPKQLENLRKKVKNKSSDTADAEPIEMPIKVKTKKVKNETSKTSRKSRKSNTKRDSKDVDP